MTLRCWIIARENFGFTWIVYCQLAPTNHHLGALLAQEGANILPKNLVNCVNPFSTSNSN